MDNIFESYNRRRPLTPAVLSEFEKDFSGAKRQISEIIGKLSGAHGIRPLLSVVGVFNSFSGDNRITRLILQRLMEHYLADVGNMLRHREDRKLYILLDLFHANDEVFALCGEDSRRDFLLGTYALLFLQPERASFLEIAGIRYIQMICSDEYFPEHRAVLERYLREAPDGYYREEVLDAWRSE